MAGEKQPRLLERYLSVVGNLDGGFGNVLFGEFLHELDAGALVVAVGLAVSVVALLDERVDLSFLEVAGLLVDGNLHDGGVSRDALDVYAGGGREVPEAVGDELAFVESMFKI